jgi:hypothetical protein
MLDEMLYLTYHKFYRYSRLVAQHQLYVIGEHCRTQTVCMVDSTDHMDSFGVAALSLSVLFCAFVAGGYHFTFFK